MEKVTKEHLQIVNDSIVCVQLEDKSWQIEFRDKTNSVILQENVSKGFLEVYVQIYKLAYLAHITNNTESPWYEDEVLIKMSAETLREFCVEDLEGENHGVC